MAESLQSNRLDIKTISADLSAGLVVFLVALPLCLGVALASNAPLFSGIVAGIVGGIIVGVISGSHTSVSGPAAGLTAVVALQITTLGSFEAFLLAVVFAGILQIVLGVVRAGSIADFVPASVIKGLLAAIGLILILKQLPHLVGHDRDPDGEMAFQQPDHETTFSELEAMLSFIHPGALLIGVFSLLVLVFWDKIKFLKRSLVPGPLIVVVAGVGLNLLLARFGGKWTIETSHLVQVPVAESFRGFLDFLRMPDLAQVTNPTVYTAAVTVAAVASLETLLNLEAVDKLDPKRRVSPPNRELVAQGVGNIIAGMIGGLPVTSVIIRSSVNINSGGKTRLATLFHGLLLLLCVAFLPGWLNLIPLSCLAAVLIVTGFKLASPTVFKRMWRGGLDQFLPFIITVGAILLTDLLIGILIGLATSIVFILRSNLRRPLRRILEHHVGGDVLRIELASQVSFLNRVALTRALNRVPRDGHVLLDARNTNYIDADVLSLIREYETEVAPARGVKISLLGFKDRYQQQPEDQVQHVDLATRELQRRLAPDQVLRILRDGNERFRVGEPLTRDLQRLRHETAEGQHPLAVVLSGTSSRTPIELIFDASVGDIFCARATGNFAGDGVLGSLEYATAVAGAKLLLVLGHTRNNAVQMAIELLLEQQSAESELGCRFLDPILTEIQLSIDPRQLQRWKDMSPDGKRAYIDEVSLAHVRTTMRRIVDLSPAISRCLQEGQIKLVGGIYDVQTGTVTFFDSDLRTIPIEPRDSTPQDSTSQIERA